MLAVDCLGAVGCIRVGVAVRVGSAKRAPGGQMISILPGLLFCVFVGLRQSGEAEGHPGFKSSRRGAGVRAKRPPRADDLLAMLMCCCAFASRMFLFCDLSCHLLPPSHETLAMSSIPP